MHFQGHPNASCEGIYFYEYYIQLLNASSSSAIEHVIPVFPWCRKNHEGLDNAVSAERASVFFMSAQVPFLFRKGRMC